MFSWDNLSNAQTAYEKLVSRLTTLQEGNPLAEDEAEMQRLKATFKEALDNDLNTSLAVTALYDVLKAKISDGAKLHLVYEFDTVLSLGLQAAVENSGTAEAQEGDAEIDALVEARTAAKKAKNFAEADRIRDQLKEMGIVLVDTKEGTTWHR